MSKVVGAGPEEIGGGAPGGTCPNVVLGLSQGHLLRDTSGMHPKWSKPEGRSSIGVSHGNVWGGEIMCFPTIDASRVCMCVKHKGSDIHVCKRSFAPVSHEGSTELHT